MQSDFDEAVRRFIKAKARRSPRTIEWYEEQFKRYAEWLASHAEADWRSPESIDDFLTEEQSKKLKQNTVSARYRALRALFRWLISRKRTLPADLQVAYDPTSEVDKPEVSPVLIEHVTYQEYSALLQSIQLHHWIDYRDRCIVTVLFWSGLRLAECAGLSIVDIETEKGLITVRKGKGDKSRIVPAAPDLRRMLLDYLMRRPSFADSSALWIADDGTGQPRKQPLTAEGIRQMLIRRCKAAKLRYMHPHAFRHGFAMEMLNNGAEMSSVSAMMGHSDTNITERIYAHWLVESLQRVHNSVYNQRNK